MNTETFTLEQKKKWIGRFLLLILVAVLFSYLNKHGISPIGAAVAIICCRGFFRFLYALACFIVTLGIIVAILSNLIY